MISIRLKLAAMISSTSPPLCVNGTANLHPVSVCDTFDVTSCVVVSPPAGHVCESYVSGLSVVPGAAGSFVRQAKRTDEPASRPQRPADPHQQGNVHPMTSSLRTESPAIGCSSSFCVSDEGGGSAQRRESGTEPEPGSGLSSHWELRGAGGGPRDADTASFVLSRPDPQSESHRHLQTQSCRCTLSPAHRWDWNKDKDIKAPLVCEQWIWGSVGGSLVRWLNEDWQLTGLPTSWFSVFFNHTEFLQRFQKLTGIALVIYLQINSLLIIIY